MVDKNLLILPSTHRPLRSLHLDINSYFATIEQQVDPSLRGKPVGVAPVVADSGCIVAASYEAKKCGVKTGTRVFEAKQLCPDIILLSGGWTKYTYYHKLILDAVETVLPIDKVCSIDEARFGLIGAECEPENARKLALQIKQAIRDVGDYISCSVGIAPNHFLSKVGTEIQKPDGLVILEAKDLPQKLFSLKLTDFAGINYRMQARLNAHGIFTSEELLNASLEKLKIAWGSVWGERWWYLLRGYQVSLPDTKRRSLGHSHVLPPELRTDQGCREVLLRLIQKATARLRAEGLCAGILSVGVRGARKSWGTHARIQPTSDTVAINEKFFQLWDKRDFLMPRAVGMVFYDLIPPECVTPSLFEPYVNRIELGRAVDRVNRKYGKNTLYLAGMQRAKDTAQEKIAFQKTTLFSEGKGDNEFPNTFHGIAR